MRLTAFSAVVLFTLASSAPAAAQIVGKRDYGPVPESSPFLPDSRLPGPGIAREVGDLEGRIESARRSGALSRGEARRLEREARTIGRLARRYGRDGLSPSERAELRNRADYLRDSLGRPRRAG